MIMPRSSRSRAQTREPVGAAPAAAVASAPVERALSHAARGTIALVALAALTVTALGMSAIRGILAPVLLTLILTICANPVRVYLQRRGVSQGLATGSVIVVVFGLLAGFFVLLFIALAQFVAMLDDYADEFGDIAATVSGWLTSLGVTAEQADGAVAALDPAGVLEFLSGALGGVVSIITALVIVLTMMILMAADAVYVPTILRQLNERRPHLVTALETYASNVRRYMVVTTVLGVGQGVLNAVALWVLDVPAALLWGLLTFVCSFIPNVGYFFALIPPLVFGFLSGGWPTAIAILVVYGVVNAVVQSIIQPRVVGNAVSLSQTLTFFSVLFWAAVLGPVGAILAIPLTLLAKALLVDADPDARMWRPVFGPTLETRDLKKLQDAGRSRKHRRKPPTVATAPNVLD
jgi:AI-2 transport protein TqsA